MTSTPIPYDRVLALLQYDACNRGILPLVTDVFRAGMSPLEAAANDLAANGRGVAIIVGGAVLDGRQASPETAGHAGAVYLAGTMVPLGHDVRLIADPLGAPVLRAACRAAGVPTRLVQEFPFEAGGPEGEARRKNHNQFFSGTDAWIADFFGSEFGGRLTHVIALHRAGPNHTLETMLRQRRFGPPPFAEFDREMPAGERNTGFDTQGRPLNAWTAKTFRLFDELAARRSPVTTIGVIDAVNQIGAGEFAWERFRARESSPLLSKAACRVATTHTIVAGASDWGAYALALALTRLHGRDDMLFLWDSLEQRRVIKAMVRDSLAIDSHTRRREASIHRLPAWEHLRTLAKLRELFDLPG